MRLRSFASSGCSGRKMSSPGTCDSQITGARTGRARSRSSITRPERVVWHPLEEVSDGKVVRLYKDAEAVLTHLPRRGLPMILRGSAMA